MNAFNPKTSTFDKTVMEQLDRRTSAFHEAGHYLIAEHFGLPAFCGIKRIGEPTPEAGAFVGRTLYSTEGLTRFRLAVIGWAGRIAECFATEDGLEELDYHYDDLELTSATDHAAVNSGTPFCWRAFKTARQILENKRERLELIAQKLHDAPGTAFTESAIFPPEDFLLWLNGW
jgi:hypothetical protein